MGAFQKLFGNWKKKHDAKKEAVQYFKMLDGYTPILTSFDGGVYEMELTRACIHAFANHASKMQPHITGADRRGLVNKLEGKPNPFMTTAQFLYKAATIYDAQNTCFIVPLLDNFERLVGYYPVNPTQVEVLEVRGEAWLRYTFSNGEKAAIELDRCGIVSKFLYKSDLKGENNTALTPTMQLLHIQNQGIKEGIKNSASIRFMATLANLMKKDDIAKERKSWVEDNLGVDAGGLALFPSSYTNVQQIRSEASLVNPELMKIAETRVLNYFGCNEDILQNKAVGDKWSGYYEGKIEPFSVQLSQAMTMMTFNEAERKRGNGIAWSSNRLQYVGTAEKLNVSTMLFDRGILSTNMVMDIWNLPHVEDGDKRYIRKEYTEVSQLDAVNELQDELASAQNAINASGSEPTDEGEEETNDTGDKDKIEG